MGDFLMIYREMKDLFIRQTRGPAQRCPTEPSAGVGTPHTCPVQYSHHQLHAELLKCGGFY